MTFVDPPCDWDDAEEQIEALIRASEHCTIEPSLDADAARSLLEDIRAARPSGAEAAAIEAAIRAEFGKLTLDGERCGGRGMQHSIHPSRDDDPSRTLKEASDPKGGDPWSDENPYSCVTPDCPGDMPCACGDDPLCPIDVDCDCGACDICEEGCPCECSEEAGDCPCTDCPCEADCDCPCEADCDCICGEACECSEEAGDCPCTDCGCAEELGDCGCDS